MHTNLGRCHDTVPLTLLIIFGIFIWAIAITSPRAGSRVSGGQDPLFSPSDPVSREGDSRAGLAGTQGSSEAGGISRSDASADSNAADVSNVDSGPGGGDAGPPRLAKILRSDEEWRTILSQEEFKVIREGGTEARGSSALLRENRPGMLA